MELDAYGYATIEGLPDRVWLEPIPPDLHYNAIDALRSRDVAGFLITAANTYGIDLVTENMDLLQDLGIYEEALLDAFTSTRTNNAECSLENMRYLFESGRPAHFRKEGDRLPGPGPFKLYRGVAGKEPIRKARGLSWTSSLEIAAWFAARFEFANPAVLEVTVEDAAVIAYMNSRGRHEREFIVLVPKSARVKTVLKGRELRALADSQRKKWAKRQREENARWARKGEYNALRRALLPEFSC